KKMLSGSSQVQSIPAFRKPGVSVSRTSTPTVFLLQYYKTRYMQATFYILHSTILDKFYIGHTTEPMEERLRKHLSSHSGFTSKAKDWKVVYTEPLPTKEDAYRREFAVKNWKCKTRILRLIAGSDTPGF